MSVNEMRTACRPSATPTAEMQEVLKTILQSMDTLREQATEAQTTLTEAQTRAVSVLESRQQAVERACFQLEKMLSARIKEAQTATEALQAIEARLRWRRRTLVWTSILGMVVGMLFLTLLLSLPGPNRILYRLVLLMGGGSL